MRETEGKGTAPLDWPPEPLGYSKELVRRSQLSPPRLSQDRGELGHPCSEGLTPPVPSLGRSWGPPHGRKADCGGSGIIHLCWKILIHSDPLPSLILLDSRETPECCCYSRRGLFKQPLPTLWGIHGDSALAPEKLEPLSLSQDMAASPRAAARRQSHSLEPSKAPSLQFDRHIAAPATLPKWTFKGWLWSLDGLKARQSPASAPEGKAGSRWERQTGVSASGPLLFKAAHLSVDGVLLVFSSRGRAGEGTSKARVGSLAQRWPQKVQEPRSDGDWPLSTRFQATQHEIHWNVITEPVNWKALGVTGAHTPTAQRLEGSDTGRRRHSLCPEPNGPGSSF